MSVGLKLFPARREPLYAGAMPEPIFQAKYRLRARALYVGERIDVRAFERGDLIAESPLLVRAGTQGCAALFRGMVSLRFSCDGSHYMPYAEFLDHDMPFWQDR